MKISPAPIGAGDILLFAEISICGKTGAFDTLYQELLAEYINDDQRRDYHKSAGIPYRRLIEVLAGGIVLCFQRERRGDTYYVRQQSSSK